MQYKYYRTIWITVNLNKNNIAIGTVYKPPSQDTNVFLEELEDALSPIIPTIDSIILAGDFNINFFYFNSTNLNKLTNVLDSLNLTQIIDSTTRITSTTATLLDLIIVGKDEHIMEKAIIDSKQVSDHLLAYCKLEVRGGSHGA